MSVPAETPDDVMDVTVKGRDLRWQRLPVWEYADVLAPGLALGQAALYGLALAWAVSLAWTLEGRDIPRPRPAVHGTTWHILVS